MSTNHVVWYISSISWSRWCTFLWIAIIIYIKCLSVVKYYLHLYTYLVHNCRYLHPRNTYKPFWKGKMNGAFAFSIVHISWEEGWGANGTLKTIIYDGWDAKQYFQFYRQYQYIYVLNTLILCRQFISQSITLHVNLMNFGICTVKSVDKTGYIKFWAMPLSSVWVNHAIKW